ncbi:hypothetical protein KSP40_PGU020518 [Platanthera guangdongensis]|uniref:Rhodanese-like domain-containing protein 4, chloroplastic n=1 Tax=Platanthera guangdongensis TaxID=2320717 RepID=A0ABR2N0U8_9ASPA
MEVLNATGLSPIPLHKSSIFYEKRSEPKRLPFRIRPLKPFKDGLASLSSILGAASAAQSLTYEEALNKTLGSSGEFDLDGIVDGVLKFASENQLIIAGGAAAVVVPLIVAHILGSSKAWGVESAKNAYAKLAEDASARLLDIREGKEIRDAGSPDVLGLKKKKKTVAIAYRGEDKAGFLKKLALKFKDPGNTTLFVLDKFDGSSKLVAELVTANGFKAAFAIKDGVEGARGWKNSGLPWLPPKKALFFDFGDLTDVIGENSSNVPVTLALAAAIGLGLFASTVIETLLQLLGSAAVIQLFTKKLLFAEDRKRTLQQIDEFLNTKVAPKELADEIKMIGKALLPTTNNSQAALPASSTETRPEGKEDGAPEPLNAASLLETEAERKVEGPPELTRLVNSVSTPELEEKAPGGPTALSPYPYYPDFKPPTSPSPSKP